MACSTAVSAWATIGAGATEAMRTSRLGFGLGLGVGRAAGAGAGGGGNSVMVAVSGGRSSAESEKRTSHCVIARCNSSDATNASISTLRGRKREDRSLSSISTVGNRLIFGDAALSTSSFPRARRSHHLYRHSRESGNPLAFDGRKMDPRFRGDDALCDRNRTFRQSLVKRSNAMTNIIFYKTMTSPAPERSVGGDRRVRS